MSYRLRYIKTNIYSEYKLDRRIKMGLFKKLKEADKAIDDFVAGTVGNAFSAAKSFANTKQYSVDITYRGSVVGRLEFKTSDPDYVIQKVNNYLSQVDSLRYDYPAVKAFYYKLDTIDIGASKQVLYLDENTLGRCLGL